MNTIGERIKYVRQQRGLTMAEIAQNIGVTKASMSSYENNKYDPGAQIIVKLCELFKVTSDWLLTGKGEMNPSNGSMPDPRNLTGYQCLAAQTCLENLTMDQAALINSYEKLNNNDKEEIWAAIKFKLSRKLGLSSNSQTSKNEAG